MIDILKYIDEMQVMYGDKDPSSMDQEPRNMFADGQLVQPNADGSRPGYSGKYGPNIRKLTQSDTLEVQIIRGGTGGGKGGQKFYKTFNFEDYGSEENALKAAKEYRESIPKIKKDTGKQSKGLPIGFKKETGGQFEIRKILKEIIEVGGKSFSNEDIRQLIDTDLFPDDDQFRKAVDVVKKEPEFKNLTFEKKPRPRLKNDPVSVLMAKTKERRNKKINILGSKDYEKELYKYKKEIQEALGLEKYKTSGSISGKPRELLPIEMGHQSSIKQLSLLKQKMRPEDLSPQNYEVNRKGVKKNKGGVQTLEDNLNKKFYPEQKKLYIQAKKFIDAGKTVPADLQNKIVSLNEDIQKFVDDTVKKYPLLKDRVNPITIDANDLTVKRGGNVFKQLGIGLVDQDLGNIKIGSMDDLTIKANLAEQTFREAVDAGLIDEVEGQKKLNKFLNAKPIEDITQDLGTLGCPKGLPSASGGRIKFDKGGACVLKGKRVLAQGLKTGFKEGSEAILATAILKGGKGLKDIASIRALLGPAAVGFIAAEQAAYVGYDVLSKGKSFKEAIGDSAFNYLLGDKTKVDAKKERNKRMIEEGMTSEQMGKIGNLESQSDRIIYGNSLLDKIEDAKQGQLDEMSEDSDFSYLPNRTDEFKKQEDDARTNLREFYRGNTNFTTDVEGGQKALAEGLRRNEIAQLRSVDNIFQSRKGDKNRAARISDLMLEQKRAAMPDMGQYPTTLGFAGGGIAGLSGGDKSGRPPESGPASQGLRSLFNNGKKR